MILMVIALIACSLIMAATVIFVFLQRKRQPKVVEVRLAEPIITAAFGFILYFIAIVLIVGQLMEGTEKLSVSDLLAASMFSVFCAVIGSGVLLFALVKAILATDRGITKISLFGKSQSADWSEITDIKTLMFSSRVNLIYPGGKISVGGNPKQYREFIELAKKRIPARVYEQAFDKLDVKML